MKLLHLPPISACHDIPVVLMPGVADPAPPGLSACEVDGSAAWLAGQVQPDLWCALPHVDPEGQTSVMIMAPDDPAVPTFVVHREDVLLRLDVVQADTYTRLGAYGALTPLLGALAAAMRTRC